MVPLNFLKPNTWRIRCDCDCKHHSSSMLLSSHLYARLHSTKAQPNVECTTVCARQYPKAAITTSSSHQHFSLSIHLYKTEWVCFCIFECQPRENQSRLITSTITRLLHARFCDTDALPFIRSGHCPDRGSVCKRHETSPCDCNYDYKAGTRDN